MKSKPDDLPLALELDESIIPRLRQDPVLFAQKICYAYPHWYQEEILLNDANSIVIRMGRQLGKTFAMAIKAIHAAFTKPGVINPEDPYVVMIIAPAQRQSQIMFEQIQRLINSSPILQQSVIKSIQQEIRFKNGAVIYNFPIGETADRVRGYAINLLIVDEAAYVPDRVFISLEPALSHTEGSMVLISTPFGRFGYFYDAIKDGVPYSDYSQMKKRGETLEDGRSVTHWYPYTVGLEVVLRDRRGKYTGKTQSSETSIKRQKRRMHPVKFAQEHEARFVDDAAMYFPLKLIMNAVEEYPMEVQPEPGCQYYMGVDFAKIADFYIAVVIKRYPDDALPMRVCNWQQDQKRDYSITVPRTAQLAKRFGVKVLFADSTGVGEPNVEKLRQMLQGVCRVESVSMASLEKQNQMYANVYELLGAGKLVLPAMNKELLTQMQLVAMTKMPSGRIKIEAASGGHDDYPDAIALACMSTLEPRYEMFVGGVSKMDKPQETQRQEMVRFIGTSAISSRDRRVMRDPITGRPIGILPWEEK